VDANILLRWLETSDASHVIVRHAIESLEEDGHILHITSQSIIEFWAVASRPTSSNGFGWDLARCATAVQLLMASFQFLPDNAAIFEEWQTLVNKYGVSGVKVHDTRLAAVMKVYELDGIFTFNVRDFQRFITESITVIEPSKIS
jgi:predicted nucleic acid-binding protein